MQISKRIENYWDKRSKDFSRVRMLEIAGADFSAWNEIIKKNLPADKNLKVLDVGTGAGVFAVLFSKLGHNVTAIDMSQKMLDEASKNISDLNCTAEFIRMNAQELNFDAETFDVVISRNLTWTLPDAMQAYKEWYRVLKRGGILMNFDSNYGDKNFLNVGTCAKGEVEYDMLVECNEIKNSLRISTHNRPHWDIELLESLGCQVSFDEDISQFVHQDKNLEYDSVPLFGIYATK